MSRTIPEFTVMKRRNTYPDGIEAQLDSVRMRFDPHEHPAAFRIMAVRMM